MMLMQVRITNYENVKIVPRVWLVLMHRLPTDSEEDIEVFHEEVRERVRRDEHFQKLRLPYGYRMDVDVTEISSDFVTSVEV